MTPAIRRIARARLKTAKPALPVKSEWIKSPTLFAEQVLGLKCWGKQARFLEAIAKHDKVATRAGHKVGKTASIAALALWNSSQFPNSVTVLTMSSARQIKLILWREMRALIERSKFRFPHMPLDPGTGLHFDSGSYVVGFSTDKTENMGGFSGSRVMFVVDEASGVDEAIFDAIEGNLAGGSHSDDRAVSKLVLSGNPTQTSGRFYDAFHTELCLYDTHHIASYDTPNAVSGKVEIPGLATSDYVEDRKAVWGEDSAQYQVRVAGNFALQGSNSVIFLSQIEASTVLYDEEEASGTLHVGVDVARFGDDLSTIALRRGNKLLCPVQCHTKFDEVDIAGFVREHISEHYKKGEAYPIVKVDCTGLGSGVASILRRDSALRVVEVNSAEKANDTDKHPNKRSELWFSIKDWLDEGGCIPPNDKELQRDLLAPLYSFDTQGRRVVESKKEIKKRLGHSPDRADALALSVYMPVFASSDVPDFPSDCRYDETRGF